MKFEKYFPLPWKSDHIVYLWSTNSNTPAMIDNALWTSEDNDLLDNICKIINGEIEPTFENVIYNQEDQTIRSNDHILLIIRGWGYLTSSGLSNKEAAEIQDEMGYWIADKLNSK